MHPFCTPVHSPNSGSAKDGNLPKLDMSTSKNRIAGKTSGAMRARLRDLRQLHVLLAFEELKPTYKMQPFSDYSLDALEKEFRNPSGPRRLWRDGGIVFLRPPPPSEKLHKLILKTKDLVGYEPPTLRNASRDTLKKDLLALGIRTRRPRHCG